MPLHRTKLGHNCCVLAAVTFVSFAALMKPALAQPARAEAKSSDHGPWALTAGLGFGNAVCDNDKPDSDCPVDGAFAIAFGGSWRFHKRFSLGAELAIWAFKIRDDWQGALDDSATEVSFTSIYLAPHLRWHWFDGMSTKPYLQAGIGFGSVTARASNDTGTFKYSASGIVVPLAIGVEWRVGKRFRLGPQAQAYLQISSQICSDEPGQAKECHPPGQNQDGEREGLLLPWRIMVMGSFAL